MSTTDRPTATYPTADHLARLEREEAAHRERLADLWADATPTEQLPPLVPAAPSSRPEQAVDAASTARTRLGTHACHIPAQPSTDQESIQDMGRPGLLSRPSMAWHPSLMQLAIGAALVLAIIGACNVAAIQAHRAARAHCHALVVSDWQAATRECRGTGSGTPVPEQVPSSPHTSPAPSEAPSPSTPPAFTRVNSPSPSTQPSSSPQDAPTWVTRDTGAAYDRTDPHSTPLGLPRCTTAPDTPLPCLASLSPDGSRAVVLEEDASLTGLVRR